MSISKKRDPRLWERAKRKACTQAKLCKHSARKMQWASRYYRTHGGRFVGKLRSDNSLKRWTRQKWRTADRKPSRGRTRYLPDKAWRKLSRDQIRRTNRRKREGYARGRQWVKQPRDVVRTLRRSRVR
jgi:hypothetical protein